MSVLSGAVAHQTMTTLDHINSDAFKWLWCLCVGTVAAAGGVMGSIMNHLTDHRPPTPPPILSFLPVKNRVPIFPSLVRISPRIPAKFQINKRQIK